MSNARDLRNSDDYDDWEYGTEPLPHESQAWIRAQKARTQVNDQVNDQVEEP